MDRSFPSRALTAAVIALVLCLALLAPGRGGWNRPLRLVGEQAARALTVG